MTAVALTPEQIQGLVTKMKTSADSMTAHGNTVASECTTLSQHALKGGAGTAAAVKSEEIKAQVTKVARMVADRATTLNNFQAQNVSLQETKAAALGAISV